MVLGTEQCTRLVAWAALVLFEVYQMTERKRKQYDTEMAALRMPAYQLPSWVFGWVWFTLKVLIVASAFFWTEYAVDVNDWTFPTVFAMLFALVVLSKFWTPLFFEWCMYEAALGLSIVLAGISITTMVIMIVSTNEGSLWALPLALFVPVVAWYCFAVLLNLEWVWLKRGWYREHHCRDEEHGSHAAAAASAGVYVVMQGGDGKHYKPQQQQQPPQKKQHQWGHPHASHHATAPKFEEL